MTETGQRDFFIAKNANKWHISISSLCTMDKPSQRISKQKRNEISI